MNITINWLSSIINVINTFYILILLILMKSKENINFYKYRIFIFILGFCLIIFSETTIRFINTILIENVKISFLPIIIFIILYLFFLYKFKFSLRAIK